MRIGATLTMLVVLAGCGGDSKGGDTAAATEGETEGNFDGALQFEGEQPFLPGLEVDTGWIPADSPAAVRATFSAGGGVTVVAEATTDGTNMEGVAGSGELEVDGSLSLEVSARIDAAGLMYEGVVESFSYDIEPATASFDPFSLDEAVSVVSMLPAQELGKVPIPSVPGASLIMEVTGGEITTEFEGACADTSDGHGQYVGRTAMSGTVACAATIEIEVPIVGTETFGPFAFDVPVPELGSVMDLGTVSLSTGERADGAQVCSVAGDDDDDDGDDGDDDDDDVGDDTGGPGDGPGDDDDDDDDTGDPGDTGDDDDDGEDPDYPNPDGSGCAGGQVSVQLGDPALGVACLPACGVDDSCPVGQTGTAYSACVFNPDSSNAVCMTEAECLTGEVCEAGVCVLYPSTHCVLLCDDMGSECPDSMACIEGACVYPV